ncbi:delta-like protein 4 [Aplochiton taeniatus]
MAIWFTSIVAIIITLSTQVLGSGVFELDLHHFQNSRGSLGDGTACGAGCRTFFRICLKNFQTVVSSDHCIFGTVITPVLGIDSFSIMNDEQNPIRLPLNNAWPGAFSLVIEAWHSPSPDLPADTSNPKLMIGSFAIQRKLGVDHEWSQNVQSRAYSELRYSYRFICNKNYYGDGCSKICTPRDDRFGHYTCDPHGQISCLPGWKIGWKGEYCEEPICLDGCSTKNGNCTMPGECICREGWQGARCDECKRHPSCKHGSCQQPWQCTCDEGWGGLLCDQDLNYCTHHRPCANGASCMNTGQGSYTCSCPPGFTGVNCDTEVGECDSQPCRNGAQCLELEKDYRCACPEGFEGTHCEHRMLTCADSPCFHNGRCRERDNGRSYMCECPAGFTGLNCEKRVDKCTSLPCSNGGRCVLHGNARVCSCRSGFTGIRCEININECALNPCANGATCVDRINDYVCLCPLGFTGRNCKRPTNQCGLRLCLNGGTCQPGASDQQPVCICPAGYSGPQCQAYDVPLNLTPRPSLSPLVEGNGDNLGWAVLGLGVGLGVLVVLLCVVGVVLQHIQKQRNRDRNADAKNNLSKTDFQKDNLVSTLQLKNSNKKAELEVDVPKEMSSHNHNNYHLDYRTSKGYNEELSKNCKKMIKEKMPLNRIYRNREECKVSTISSPRDLMYQSVFLIAEEKHECVIATEV